MTKPNVWLRVLAIASLLAAVSDASAQSRTERMEQALENLAWRSIGPAVMGGRTVDIAGIPGDPSTVYMATASGGLFKTTNNGTTWSSIFNSGNTLSLGAVAVAPSDPNVIYIGTGENNPRNSASIGDGVPEHTALFVRAPVATAVRRGRKCSTSTKTPAPPTSPWIPRIRASSTRACTTSGAWPGAFAGTGGLREPFPRT